MLILLCLGQARAKISCFDFYVAFPEKVLIVGRRLNFIPSSTAENKFRSGLGTHSAGQGLHAAGI